MEGLAAKADSEYYEKMVQEAMLLLEEDFDPDELVEEGVPEYLIDDAIQRLDGSM